MNTEEEQIIQKIINKLRTAKNHADLSLKLEETASYFEKGQLSREGAQEIFKEIDRILDLFRYSDLN